MSTSSLLRKVAAEHPPYRAAELWSRAMDNAWALPALRGDDERPAKALTRLKESLAGEIVAFHKLLNVTKAQNDTNGWNRWRIGVPVTLFPKRNEGFTRVECAVEFEARPDRCFRVVDALPEDQTQVMGEAQLGAEVQVEASAKAGAPLPLPAKSTVASVAAKVYGRAKTNLHYSVTRAVVTAEVTHGTGAVWRLENTGRPDELTAEGHRLSVIVETDGSPTLDAAGYLKAYSEVQWLSSDVGSLLKSLGESFRKYVDAGAPAETYGEWSDILSHSS